ncbi:hypothetical protein PT974_12117 [Cladobotryum mycophilum]|uniref:Uncharacterized protein n=1 Tax=Cladobotryum mycophilum TaxID=491253 RepID=A0ABR0S8K8_9HYPO
MSRRGGSPEGSFYFQAWHVDKVLSGESWLNNKAMADYVDQNLSPESKRWLYVKACIPTKSKASLAVPYSICVKRRAPKLGQEDEGEKCVLQFRDKEYPSIAKRYFLTRLRKTLDFFNAYSEGIADPDSPLANFTEVKSSKQLSQRVQAAIRHVKKESWGDIVEGLLEGTSVGSDFKASKFIVKRGQDPIKQDPHVLPTAPLQTILLSSDGSGLDNRFASQESLPQMDDASSVGSAHSEDTSATSVSDQSYDTEEAVEPCHTEESAETSAETSAAIEPTDSGVEKITQSSASSYGRAAAVRTSSSKVMVVRKQQMAYMMSGNSQLTFMNIQNPRKLLQSMFSGANFSLPNGVNFFNSPMIIATAGSPLQSLQADGSMRLFFLSKAKKPTNEDDKDGQEDTDEWVVGSVKLSARPRTLKGDNGSAYPTKSFLPPAPESNRYLPAPEEKVHQTSRIVEIEEVSEVTERTTIIEHEKRILHIETKTVTRIIEDVDDNAEKKEKKRRGKKRRSSPSSRSRTSTTKKTTETTSSAPRKSTKTSSHNYQFKRETWRSEPQPPERFCDVVSGGNFLHVEDFEVFSFSAMTHETLQRYAGFEDSDGINVWAPPSMKVVGVLSWMWDNFNVNPWAKAAS